MSKINEAVHDIHYMDAMSAKDKWINQIHPLAKLIVTISYILAVVSFDKYGCNRFGRNEYLSAVNNYIRRYTHYT